MSTTPVIVDLFRSGGPYTLAAILLVMYLRLWGKLGDRDSAARVAQERHEARMERLNTEYIRILTEHSRASAELTATLREMTATIKRCER